MPRQSRGSAAPRRPVAAPSRPSAPPQQSRQASTLAHPPAQAPQAQQAQGQKGPGLFGQMASTAAGVAVGSSIGHAIGGMFGGSSSAPAETQQTNSTGTTMDNSQYGSAPCQMDVQNFRRCMDENQGSLTICGWYLDQLKACQAAASQY